MLGWWWIVKLTTEALSGLIDEEDPVPTVWETLWEMWYPAGESIKDHYDREKAALTYEQLLADIYLEFYQEILPTRCVNEAALTVPQDGTFLVMDAMSIREAALFVEALESWGYEPDVGYSYSAIPSETKFYRDRIDYKELRRNHITTDVKSQEPALDGDEELIWCRYPDALVENIQEGKTKLSSIEDMYETTEATLKSILDQLETDRVVIGSDHGYTRFDAGHSFPISEQHKDALQALFSSRFVSVGEKDGQPLVDAGLITEADGYYMPIGRYTWPTGGKYGTFTHGGVSLFECLTPRIEISLQ